MRWKVMAALLLALLALGGASGALAEGPNAVLPFVGCQTTTLPRNDDGSSPAVPLPFPVDFFGSTYNQVWVNNNGNVTFDGPLYTTSRSTSRRRRTR